MSWRDLFKKRTLVYGGSSIAAVVLVVGILAVISLLATRFSYRWDTTADKSQSLTAVSRALVSEVKQPLTMTAFFPDNHAERTRGKETLQMYTHANPKFSFKLVDPERDPLKSQNAGYRYPGNVLLEYQGRKQMADKADEETLTNAVRKLLKPEMKKVYFLTGHGERSLHDNDANGFSTARTGLENEGLQTETINLLSQAEIPKDAAALVIPGPSKPLFANEVAAVKAYLGRGGKVLVLLAPFKDGGLKDFLAGYGVELNNGMILDMNQVTQAIGASAIMPVAMNYGPHRITQKSTNILTIFPLARPLTLKKDVKDVALLPLVSTTNSSWEKVGQDWMKGGQATQDPKERKGPFTLAAIAEIKLEAKKEEKGSKPEKEAQKEKEENKTFLVVYGDVEFAANGYFNLSGNGDLFLNTVNFLASEEKQILVRRAEKKSQPLTLLGWQGWVLFLTAVVLMPLIILGAGIRAYLRRRGRR